MAYFYLLASLPTLSPSLHPSEEARKGSEERGEDRGIEETSIGQMERACSFKRQFEATSVTGAAHLDHLLAHPHELVVQLRVHHLHLLQLEHLLVAAGRQLLLILLQALDHLEGGKGDGGTKQGADTTASPPYPQTLTPYGLPACVP